VELNGVPRRKERENDLRYGEMKIKEIPTTERKEEIVEISNGVD